MRRTAPTLIALACLIVLAVLFRAVQRMDLAGRREPGPGTEDIVLRADSAVMQARSAGRPVWRLKADRIELRPAPGGDIESYRSADFLGIHDGALLRAGRTEATFRARRATYDPYSRRFDVAGGMELRFARGDVLSADRCVWSENDEFARFPEGARGVVRGYRLSAPSVLYSLRRRRLECPQGAEAAIRGESIQAAGLTWDLDRGLMRCRGPVSGRRAGLDFVAQAAELDLKARRLRANKGSVQLRIDSQNDGWEGSP